MTTITTPRAIQLANNQIEFEIEFKKVFQSYDSIICIINYENSTIEIWRHWDYSRTTTKYFMQFMRKFWEQTSKTIRKAIENGFLGNFKVIYNESLV